MPRSPYQTARWRTLARSVVEEHPICELRLPGCGHLATGASHILAPGDGGPFFARSNVEAACTHCRVIRAAQARSRRAMSPEERTAAMATNRNTSRKW